MFLSISFVGAQATASATATILMPISITKTVDMNFGSLVVNNTPGTVVLTPTGSRTATGGVSFITATPGTVTAASFDITGINNGTYSITLPASLIIKLDGSNAMVVNNFISTPTPTGTLSGAGTETLTVGATLNVPASQQAGVYVSEISSPFTVTVNYN